MVYYAHSKQIYNTSREKSERELLSKIFGRILCPNRDIGELSDIKPYLNRIEKCSTLVVTEYRKHIGYGVFCEINHALNLKLPVYVLRDEIFIRVKNTKLINENDWKVKYGKVIT